jgi:hypothetical protein
LGGWRICQIPNKKAIETCKKIEREIQMRLGKGYSGEGGVKEGRVGVLPSFMVEI